MFPSKFLLSVCLATGVALASAQTNVSPPTSTTVVGTGLDYSRGDYGFAQDTEVLSIPLNLRHESGPWTLTASVSYLTLKGPATVVAGGGAPRPTASSESGLGDIYAGATYAFGSIGGEVNMAATVRVKLPTADEDRGLGTGAADYYGELVFYRTFNTVTPFLTVGYRVLGDTDTYDLKDGAYGALGAHVRVSPATVITPLVNWRRQIVAGGDDSCDAMLMVTHDVSAHWQIVGYVLKGFGDASPDVGASLAVNRKF